MKSKMPFAYILGVLFLIPFAYIMYMGFMFLTEGETIKSLLWTLVLALYIGVSIWLLPISKSSNRLQVGKFGEWTAWGLFLISAIFAFLVPFSHFFSVLSNEDPIAEQYKKSYEVASKIYPAYEKYADKRIKDYSDKLSTISSGRHSRTAEYDSIIGVAAGDDDTQKIKNLKGSLIRKIKPQSDTSIEEFNEWLTGLDKPSVWNVKMVNNITSLDAKITDFISRLTEMSSQFNPGEERVKFAFTDYDSNYLELKKLYAYWKFPSNLAAWICFIVCMLVWVYPWKLAGRSMKAQGNQKDDIESI